MRKYNPFNFLPLARTLFYTASRQYSERSFKPPTIPLLDYIISDLPGDYFKNMMIVGSQHYLPSLYPQIECCIKKGAIPSDIYIIDIKPYTSKNNVFNALYYDLKLKVFKAKIVSYDFRNNDKFNIEWFWDIVKQHIEDHSGRIKRILLLDDGANVAYNMPIGVRRVIKSLGIPLVGIEQTIRGQILLPQPFFPRVLVSSCAVKKDYEPRIIGLQARSSLRKWLKKKNLVKESMQFGIVGAGAIGKELYRLLNEEYNEVLLYDKKKLTIKCQCKMVESITDLLFDGVDVIILATGQDSTQGLYSRLIKERKKDLVVVSISSGNIEVISWLKEFYRKNNITRPKNPTTDLCIKSKSGANIHIVFGGTPVNFLLPENSKRISPTVSLMLQGIKQAASINDFKPRDIMVDPVMQLSIMKRWFAMYRRYRSFYTKKMLATYENDDIELIKKRSQGYYEPNIIPAKSNAKKNPVI